MREQLRYHLLVPYRTNVNNARTSRSTISAHHPAIIFFGNVDSLLAELGVGADICFGADFVRATKRN
jgi:hypothetical protein